MYFIEKKKGAVSHISHRCSKEYLKFDDPKQESKHII